jgi:outer membrane protein assembly factor BamB
VSPYLSSPTLFYSDSSSNVLSFQEPIIDSQGNLVFISNHSGGIRLNSVSPSGALNWQTPHSGFIASRNSSSPVIGPSDVTYIPTSDSVLYAFDSRGQPRINWPVNMAPTGAANWQFPGTSPVLVDQASGLVFASTRPTISFGAFPLRIVASNPDGTLNWSVDYPDHARNSAAGNLIQGPNQNICTFLFTNTSARFTSLDRFSGVPVCDQPTGVGSDRAGGDSLGVFTDNNRVVRFIANCSSGNVPNYDPLPGSTFEFRKYGRGLKDNEGIVFGIEFPSDPAQNKLVAVSVSRGFLWRSDRIAPSTDQPIRVIKNGLVYVLGLDRDDNNKLKLFVIDASSGVISSMLDTTNICGSCGVSVSNNGRVYLTDSANAKIYKVTIN